MNVLGRLHPSVAALALLLPTGCASAEAPEHDAATVVLSTTEEYRFGVEAEVHLPDPPPPGPVPVVVMVPGGSWERADRSRVASLAETLAGEGMVVVNASYRAARDDVVYPVPVQDVTCAASWAVEYAAEQGYAARSLVLVGHSAGAHLAALASLGPDEFADDCPAEPAAPTGLVGLAGPYDLSAVEGLAESLVGAPRSQAAEVWTSADPMRRAGDRPEVDVLLLHGDADRTVSPAVSREFAVALRHGGHDVTLDVLPGVDHMGLVVAADVAATVIARWVGEHAAPRPSASRSTVSADPPRGS